MRKRIKTSGISEKLFRWQYVEILKIFNVQPKSFQTQTAMRDRSLCGKTAK